ncbi:unnamed protein product [Caretta caretta]
MLPYTGGRLIDFIKGKHETVQKTMAKDGWNEGMNTMDSVLLWSGQTKGRLEKGIVIMYCEYERKLHELETLQKALISELNQKADFNHKLSQLEAENMALKAKLKKPTRLHIILLLAHNRRVILLTLTQAAILIKTKMKLIGNT